MPAVHQEILAEIPHLRRYARALARDVVAADDLLQEGLARALTKMHLWQEGTNLRAWLCTILHNQHVDEVRRTTRAGKAVELSEAEPLLSRPADQDQRLEMRDLDRALARLPEEQRAVILLIGLKGMAYQDVGAVLGMPVGTVRSRLSRGRDALRRLLREGLDQPVKRAATAALPGTRGGDRAPFARRTGQPTRVETYVETYKVFVPYRHDLAAGPVGPAATVASRQVTQERLHPQPKL